MRSEESQELQAQGASSIARMLPAMYQIRVLFISWWGGRTYHNSQVQAVEVGHVVKVSFGVAVAAGADMATQEAIVLRLL